VKQQTHHKNKTKQNKTLEEAIALLGVTTFLQNVSVETMVFTDLAILERLTLPGTRAGVG
jgi:hypothetical protein